MFHMILKVDFIFIGPPRRGKTPSSRHTVNYQFISVIISYYHYFCTPKMRWFSRCPIKCSLSKRCRFEIKWILSMPFYSPDSPIVEIISMSLLDGRFLSFIGKQIKTSEDRLTEDGRRTADIENSFCSWFPIDASSVGVR